MPKQFDSEMGAVRIFSKGEQVRHRGEDMWNPPTDWAPIKASKYFKPSWFGSGKTSLDEVVRSGILDSIATVLIIVHMYRGGWDTKTVSRQASVIEAAKGRQIPIYVVQKEDPGVNIKLAKDILPQLPEKLGAAVGAYSGLFYYAEKLLGNALEGKEFTNGRLLRQTLKSNGVHVAIVFGQSYGQCVDSTILGMFDKRPTDTKKPQVPPYYAEGLLDIGIDVVTARDVLEPPPNSNAINSPYFFFDMGGNIVLSSPSREPAPAQGSPTRSSVLEAPTSFPEKSATKAATDV